MKSEKLHPKEKYIPKSLIDREIWDFSRRNFIKTAIIAGAFSQITFLSACREEKIDTKPLTKEDFKLIQSIQNILFPKDQYGPGAKDVNADKYVLWVLNDERIDPDENQYLINGIKWTNETAQETHSKNYNLLSQKQKEALVKKISKESWGENWLSMLLTLIIEAMISDPIYGFNKDGIGWKWLHHTPGQPRPDETLMYDAIMSI